MKFIFIAGPLVIVAVVFVSILISCLIDNKKNKYYKEKYGVTIKNDQQKRKDIAEKLLKKANDAIRQNDYDNAFTYIKDSHYLDPDGKYPILYSKYYYAIGDVRNGENYQFEAQKKGIPEIYVIHATNYLKKDKLADAKEWCQKATEKNAYGAKELKEKIIKRENELTQQTYKEIEKAIEEVQAEIAKANIIDIEQKDYLVAAKIYTDAYTKLEKVAQLHKDIDLSRNTVYHDNLKILSTKAALMYYKESFKETEYSTANEYNEAQREEAYKWLKKIDKNNLPEYYYVKAGLGYAGKTIDTKTKDAMLWWERRYSTTWDDLSEYVRIADEASIPGAAELKKKIRLAYIKELEREISHIEWEQEEERTFMKEHNGMSREEYEEYQVERAENRRKANEAMAAKERKAAKRNEIENLERDLDVLIGGSGYSVEEKALRGEISQSEYAEYDALKNKYIDKDS